ncbi:MAG: hypothetical protein WCX88_00405 [Patescibacteria group bacterium]
MEKIRTSYGYKLNRPSSFVIVAPHAGGDDFKTATISRQLAESLNASVIVNRKFFKEGNKKAKLRPRFVEDFNQLRWSHRKDQYIWGNKKVAMKEFFDDISNFCDLAHEYNSENKAIVVYLHGIKNEEIGIDLGVGIKAKGDGNKFVESIYDEANNSGKATIKISKLKKIRKKISEALKEKFNLAVTIGRIFIGWSKRSAVQFHKHEGRNDYAIQFEINRQMRRKENREYLINLLKETLEEAFN